LVDFPPPTIQLARRAITQEEKELKMKKFVKIALLATAMSLFVVPAASAATLIGSGSVAMQPYIVALTNAYKKVNPGVTIAYNANGGNAGVKDVQKGVSQFAGQARAPLPADAGTTYVEAFKDGMGIVVNPKNKTKNLSLQQVSDIFTGKITSWSQIKGSGVSAPITPFGRESSAGQYTYFIASVLNGAPQATNVTTVLSDGLVRSGVASAPSKSGIGYIGQAYLNKKVKAVTLNHVPLLTKNVKNNKYPLSRFLYFVTPATGVNADVAAFIDWARTSVKAGQVLAKAGAVTVFNKTVKKKKKKAKKSSFAAQSASFQASLTATK
jgi:phosphate transport system substrate-binding protein